MAFMLVLLLAVWSAVRWVEASFNLYPGVNPDKLAQNQTIPECDQTLLQMTQSLENYWWTDDNLTAICAPNNVTKTSCADAVTAWNGASAAACDEQYFAAYGQLLPIWSVTERFRDSLSFACLESSSDNFTWCLTESQEWVGADALPVDCDVNPNNPPCSGNVTSIHGSNIRMANLYEDDILCNGCFINQLHARVISPFLPGSDHSDYLVDQLYDIQDVCNVTLPDYTVRLLDWYDMAPPLTSSNLVSTMPNSPSNSPLPSASTICTGQSVVAGSNATCDTLSLQYGVSTGTLQWFSSSDTCNVSSCACLPQACNLKRTTEGDTCASLAASIGNTNSTTLAQFLKWNPYILGLCDSLLAGQYVCISPPGLNGTFAPPDPPLGTDADASNQQRGGPGGVVSPTTTVTTTAKPVWTLERTRAQS
ncbi:hypothetical protein F4777DRAFT_582718 [Nemania sp. FL0916]|nr:hypothetical protein F4777DRAFT_582718 [Nemania sp. FL0916]